MPEGAPLAVSFPHFYQAHPDYQQVCVTRVVHSVSRIRDVFPGSDFFPSRIRIKEFKYFNKKKWFPSSRKYDPGCSSRIRMLTFYPSRIQDPGAKKAPDPGSGTLVVHPEAEFWDEIQTKVLIRVSSLLPGIHRHLYSFALRFLFLQTPATSYSFYSSVTQ
jgi:hypothetical protein